MMNDTSPAFCIPPPVAPPMDPGYVVFPANNWLYQIANILLLISYVAPSLLALRVILALASLCYALWGALVLKISIDTTVWNGIFVIINVAQAVWILYNMRPITFEPEFEVVYSAIFGPGRYNLPRIDFLPLAKSGFVRKIKKGRYYCHDDDDCNHYVTKRVGGTKIPVLIGIDEPVCFIDSPEWLNQKKPDAQPGSEPQEPPKAETDVSDIEKGHHFTVPFIRKGQKTKARKPRLLQAQKYNVSIKAREDSIYVVWQYENLSKVLTKTPSLAGALDAVVGYDVYKKLIRAQELHIADLKLSDRTKDTLASPRDDTDEPIDDAKEAKQRINRILSTFGPGKSGSRKLLAPGNIPDEAFAMETDNDDDDENTGDEELAKSKPHKRKVSYSMEHLNTSLERSDDIDEAMDQVAMAALRNPENPTRSTIPLLSPRSRAAQGADPTRTPEYAREEPQSPDEKRPRKDKASSPSADGSKRKKQKSTTTVAETTAPAVPQSPLIPEEQPQRTKKYMSVTSTKPPAALSPSSDASASARKRVKRRTNDGSDSDSEASGGYSRSSSSQ